MNRADSKRQASPPPSRGAGAAPTPQLPQRRHRQAPWRPGPRRPLRAVLPCRLPEQAVASEEHVLYLFPLLPRHAARRERGPRLPRPGAPHSSSTPQQPSPCWRRRSAERERARGLARARHGTAGAAAGTSSREASPRRLGAALNLARSGVAPPGAVGSGGGGGSGAVRRVGVSRSGGTGGAVALSVLSTAPRFAACDRSGCTARTARRSPAPALGDTGLRLQHHLLPSCPALPCVALSTERALLPAAAPASGGICQAESVNYFFLLPTGTTGTWRMI